jgi:hypothetical protein
MQTWMEGGTSTRGGRVCTEPKYYIRTPISQREKGRVATNKFRLADLDEPENLQKIPRLTGHFLGASLVSQHLRLRSGIPVWIVTR